MPTMPTISELPELDDSLLNLTEIAAEFQLVRDGRRWAGLQMTKLLKGREVFGPKYAAWIQHIVKRVPAVIYSDSRAEGSSPIDALSCFT